MPLFGGNIDLARDWIEDYLKAAYRNYPSGLMGLPIDPDAQLNISANEKHAREIAENPDNYPDGYIPGKTVL